MIGNPTGLFFRRSDDHIGLELREILIRSEEFTNISLLSLQEFINILKFMSKYLLMLDIITAFKSIFIKI